MILEVRDDPGRPSGLGSAQRMDTKGDALLVVHVEEADAPIVRPVHQSLLGEDAGDAGIDLCNRPPVDDLPIRIACRFIVHGIWYRVFLQRERGFEIFIAKS